MLLGLLIYVRFTSESGHPEGSRKESAFDPKRTLRGMSFQVRNQAGAYGKEESSAPHASNFPSVN